ncbi:hypothetical protein PY365_12445 [Roseiarcaceae bacterium H3SJ34-1]|uniref:hypothetical protein n=1 Tax=Terripilifer ovatus TaxID=3032367 RepID=UPI003AB9ACFE|nr:hypothetical protein [Roseiarcaceae bacterium H3SJ34-1]
MNNPDTALLALGQQFAEAHRAYSDATLAFSRVEMEASLAQLELLGSVVDASIIRLLAVQYAITHTPAFTVEGLRVKAIIFASRWTGLEQMKEWDRQHHTVSSQDPQEMAGISMVLDLLEGGLS